MTGKQVLALFPNGPEHEIQGKTEHAYIIDVNGVSILVPIKKVAKMVKTAEIIPFKRK